MSDQLLKIIMCTVVATSVPSERLFSAAGMTVSNKRAALDRANVEKLVFLHSNLEVPHLDYKRAKCTCTIFL